MDDYGFGCTDDPTCHPGEFEEHLFQQEWELCLPWEVLDQPPPCSFKQFHIWKCTAEKNPCTTRPSNTHPIAQFENAQGRKTHVPPNCAIWKCTVQKNPCTTQLRNALPGLFLTVSSLTCSLKTWELTKCERLEVQYLVKKTHLKAHSGEKGFLGVEEQVHNIAPTLKDANSLSFICTTRVSCKRSKNFEIEFCLNVQHAVAGERVLYRCS